LTTPRYYSNIRDFTFRVTAKGEGEECKVARRKPGKTTLEFNDVDWQMLQALREALHTPTTSETIRNLIRLVDGIVSYQKQGYRLQLTKQGKETIVIFMPTQPPPTPSG